VLNYYVYIMSNLSRTLYVGVTRDLERRVWEHKQKTIPGFTKRYNLTMLVYCESYPDPLSAIAREKELMGWLRAKKVALIERENPRWLDLSADWYT
jgi:putative endonuclease